MRKRLKNSIVHGLIGAFLFNSLGPLPAKADALLGLPEPGKMVLLSPAYEPAIIKGIKIHADKPFQFDFIVDPGQNKLSGLQLEAEGQKLIKYFLAGLAIPENEVWVNLSPYEKERIVPATLSQTEMGRDLLAQDYILKQITSSLIYPEEGLGKKFWDRIYKKAQELYGAQVNIPVNTFNKVWIMADRADIFERNQTAFVVKSHLKVMLEEDYLALTKNTVGAGPRACPTCIGQPQGVAPTKDTHTITSQIIRQIILPELDKEINTGAHFANLRQIYNSLILAAWYKKTLKNALLNKVYADKEKVKGIALEDVSVKDQIYQRYLQAYKKGVFNYIKEDVVNGQIIPRKYFSGGMSGKINFAMNNSVIDLAAIIPKDRAMVDMNVGLANDAAMAQQPDSNAPFNDDVDVITRKRIKLKVGDLRKGGDKDLQKRWVLHQVYFSRDIREFPIKWSDGTPLDRDSFGRGKHPHYLYVFRQKDQLDSQDADEIFGGSEDINKTFSKYGPMGRSELVNRFSEETVQRLVEDGFLGEIPGDGQQLYIRKDKQSFRTELSYSFSNQAANLNEYFMEINNKFKDIQNAVKSQHVSKREENLQYYELVERMRKIVRLFLKDQLGEEVLDVYGDLNRKLNGQVEANEKGVGIGDASYDHIIDVYALFSVGWRRVLEPVLGMAMEEFFEAWDSFNSADGRRYIRRISERSFINKKVEGILSIRQARFIRSFIEQLNQYVDNKESPKNIKDRSEFLGQIKGLRKLYDQVKAAEGSMSELRLDVGRGQHPVVLERDRVRSSKVHADMEIAKYLRANAREGQRQSLLVLDAQQGSLRRELGVGAGQFDILDIEHSLYSGFEGLPVGAAVGDLKKIDEQGQLPVTAQTKAAEGYVHNGFLSFSLMPDQIIASYALSGLSPVQIRRVLIFVMTHLKPYNVNGKEAPRLILALPAGISLEDTDLERLLYDLGFERVAGADDLKYTITEVDRDKFKRRIRQENTGIDEKEVGRQLRAQIRLVEKEFQLGVYARVREAKPQYKDLDQIPPVGLERKNKELISQSSNERLPEGGIHWGHVDNIRQLLEDEGVFVDLALGESIDIVKRNDGRIKGFEDALSALDMVMRYTGKARADLDLMRQRWDVKKIDYVSLKNYKKIIKLAEEMVFSKSEVKLIFSREVSPGQSRPDGVFSFDDIIAVLMQDAIDQLPDDTISAIKVYQLRQSVLMDAAMLNDETKRKLRAESRQEIDRRLAGIIKKQMEQGKIPSFQTAVEAYPQQNQRGFLDLLRMRYPQVGTDAELVSIFDRQIKSVVIEMMQFKAVEVVANMPGHAIPSYRRIAQGMYEHFPYFKTWHDHKVFLESGYKPLNSLVDWIQDYGDTQIAELIPGKVEQDILLNDISFQQAKAGLLWFIDMVGKAPMSLNGENIELSKDVINQKITSTNGIDTFEKIFYDLTLPEYLLDALKNKLFRMNHEDIRNIKRERILAHLDELIAHFREKMNNKRLSVDDLYRIHLQLEIFIEQVIRDANEEVAQASAFPSLTPVEWKQEQVRINVVVEGIRNDARGMFPNIFDVSSRLYADHESYFRKWVDNRGWDRVKAIADSSNDYQNLERMYSSLEEDAIKKMVLLSRELIEFIQNYEFQGQGYWRTELYKKYHFYAPSLDDFSYENSSIPDSEKIKRSDIKALPGRSGQTLEVILTSLFMFESVTRGHFYELLPKIRASIGRIDGLSLEDIPLFIARLRYLWDSQGVSFLTRDQIRIINEIVKIGLSPVDLFNMDQLTDFVSKQDQPLSNILINGLLSSNDFNLVLLRPAPIRPLVLIGSIVKRRDDFKQVKNMGNDINLYVAALNRPLLAKGLTGILDPETALTMTNVAPALTHYGLPFQDGAASLRQWFASEYVKSYGITPEFYGIADSAMTAEGGINLDTNALQLNVDKERSGVEVKVDQAMIDRVLKEGVENLTPTIYSITEIKSIWPLVGLQPPQ